MIKETIWIEPEGTCLTATKSEIPVTKIQWRKKIEQSV